MKEISQKQEEVLINIIKELNKNKIEYEIVGGLAAIFYGSKRPLFDIDIDIHRKDFKKISNIFKKFIIEKPHRTKSNSKFDIYVMRFNIKGVQVDFSQAENSYVIDEKSVKHRIDSNLKSSNEVNFKGIKVRISSKDDLIEYKKLLNRVVDIEDLKYIA